MASHQADVKCVQFAASHNQWDGDGDEIALSALYDDTSRVWAEDAGDWYFAACLKNKHSSTIWTLTVAPSGTRLISGSADDSLVIFKCYTAPELRKLNSADAQKSSEEGDRNSNQHAAWKCVGRLPNAHSLTIYSVHCAPARVGHGRIMHPGVPTIACKLNSSRGCGGQ